MTKQQLLTECDMIEGNINRMMVTDNKEELYEMYYWASSRLGTLLRENRKRIEAKNYKGTRGTIYEDDFFDWNNEFLNG